MKMFGKRLSDQDIANVATYVRSNFGNDAGAVTAEQVNAQR
jgi:mono/diheme cytochrome c family protein